MEANSRLRPDRFRQLMLNTGELVMDMGSVLDGSSAVKEGLIDDLGSLSDAIEKLYDLIGGRGQKAVEGQSQGQDKERACHGTSLQANQIARSADKQPGYHIVVKTCVRKNTALCLNTTGLIFGCFSPKGTPVSCPFGAT